MAATAYQRLETVEQFARILLVAESHGGPHILPDPEVPGRGVRDFLWLLPFGPRMKDSCIPLAICGVTEDLPRSAA
jgi:hypothetical protein